MTSTGTWTSATSAPGFSAFVRAVAGTPTLDPNVAARHGELAAGGVVIDGCYEVSGVLALGGLGTIYRARDRNLGRAVAIKMLRLEALAGDRTGQIAALLEREALATAALNHPNIVTVYRYGVWQGLPFLVLELVAGEPLAARMVRRPLAEAEAIRITDQILAALEHAHALGVTHRDLSPRNVLVRDDGVVKLLDFGLSSLRALAATGATSLAVGTTIPGAGTPGYMAPEQQRGEPTDARSDLWAVGVLLEQMLTGGRGPGDRQALSRRPAAYLTRACAEAAADRFGSAAEMRTALPRPSRRPPWPWRRRLAVAGPLLVLLLAASLVAASTGRSGPTASAGVEARPSLVVNGSFEEPVVAAHSYRSFVELPGWRLAYGDSIEVQHDIAGPSAAGQQHVELDGNISCAIYQMVLTRPGTRYRLTYSFAPRPGRPLADNRLEVWWDGRRVDGATGVCISPSSCQWQRRSVIVEAAGVSTRLELRDAGVSNGWGTYVDDVELVAVAGADPGV